MEYSSVQLDLDTLLHTAHPGITAVTTAGTSSDVQLEEPINALLRRKHNGTDVTLIQTVFESNKQQSEGHFRRTVLITGTDVGEFPTQYEVHALCRDELPVIGTYVHPWITPGFKYLVRVLGNRPRYLFGSDATYLQSIGRGYGKRITFEGESLNYNSNYFYSDSNEKGFGFTLVAVQTGDSFVVCDEEGFALGQGTVRNVIIQKEAMNLVQDDGSLVKHVAVSFTCEVKYGPGKHGLMPLCSLETMEINGTAVVMKPKHSRKAFTKTITNVILPNCGSCVLKFASI